MRQAVSTAQIDEHAKAADARYPSAPDLAFLELGKEPVFLLAAPLLKGGAFRQDDAIAPAIDLDDLDAEGAADGRAQRAVRVVFSSLWAHAHELREGHEGVHALDVDEQAALVVAGDLGFEAFALFKPLLEHAPAALAAGAIEREDDLSLGGLGLKDVDEHLVAGLQASQRPQHPANASRPGE